MTEKRNPDIVKKFLEKIGRDYWSMSTKNLELLASKHKIGDYVDNVGPITRANRRLIIEQLVFRDKFASSFIAVLISLLALAVSILIAIFK